VEEEGESMSLNVVKRCAEDLEIWALLNTHALESTGLAIDMNIGGYEQEQSGVANAMAEGVGAEEVEENMARSQKNAQIMYWM
jgi:hypothetical protein